MNQYPIVPIEPEEYTEWCKPWNLALIIIVLGKRYNVYTLKGLLCKLWGMTDFDLIDIPNNYFVVKFSNREGWTDLYKKVLYEGPWVVQQHSELVQRWTPHFDPYNNPLRRIATWIRIPNIPLHCYNKTFITRLGNKVGKTLKVDLKTLTENSTRFSNVERGRFARVCVELDLQKKLVPRVIAANSIYNVEYEGLYLICFACGRYGHRKETCSWTLKTPQQLDPGNSNETKSDAASASRLQQGKNKEQPDQDSLTANLKIAAEEEFGSWMIVNRRGRFRTQRNNMVKETKRTIGSGSRNVRGYRGENSQI
ncbi:uncharacterized protein LOC114714268 [Neltuma alba]|uniref:uncharacterized protein LOC114714268 n=1 Tax=Neltuma alba TaxID=207710 RepID=UPI0010A547AD|nr:uncharacterized protein LOC114714268 [Prosopis alba]